MSIIRNIYCVGRNYSQHAEELGNDVPTSPMFFSKPTHALVEATGQAIALPGNRGDVHYEAEFVIRIGKPYAVGMKAEDVIDAIGLGIDFTLRDVQSELKKKGHPWLLAKGFPNSAVITRMLPFPGMDVCERTEFSLLINGERVQHATIREMIFDLQTILDFAATHYGVGEGDLIYTGTPAGVGASAHGDRMQLFWGDELLGECTLHMEN
ncbi:UNVERIFIED_CONTAM: fumarylpyruvate hydrolase [Brevibacillus sp. OAP136]